MLVVLMAIVDFSRMKIHAATRWLWLVLSGGLFVAAPIGCDDEEPQVLYGPPADTVVLDASEDEGPQPEYGPAYDVVQDVAVEDYQVLYGPPPDYIEYDVQPLYGPVEVYVDHGQQDAKIEEIQVLYGPPVDYIEPDAAAEDIATDDAAADVNDDLPQVLYGPAAK